MTETLNADLKPVTLWSREQEKGKYVYNHLEDGWPESDKPTIKHPAQASWKNSNWTRERAYITPDYKVQHLSDLLSETTRDDAR